MTLFRLIGPAAVGLLSLAAHDVSAQGYSNFCIDETVRLCGYMPLSECSWTQPGFWDNLAPECFSEVDSMIYGGPVTSYYDDYQPGHPPLVPQPSDYDEQVDYATICEMHLTEACGSSLVSDCFATGSLWSYMPSECFAYVDAVIADEHHHQVQTDRGSGLAAGNYDLGGTQSIMVDAFSWGGNLRYGPSDEYSILRYVPEGESITILESTGAYFQGYEWFWVLTGAGEGYHWGGVICTRDPSWVEGISGVC